MRILVVSDTHRDYYALNNAVMQQPKAEVVLHLGDGEEEIQRIKIEYPQKMVVAVRGNCDWGSSFPTVETLTLEGHRLFLTHGHMYQVKMGLYNLCCAAREQQAEIALFGHTHQALQDYEDGLYLLNPGSLNGYQATYGIVDLTPAGIVTNVMKLR